MEDIKQGIYKYSFLCISGKNTKNTLLIYWWNVDRYYGHNDIIDTLFELKAQIRGSPERIFLNFSPPNHFRESRKIEFYYDEGYKIEVKDLYFA